MKIKTLLLSLSLLLILPATSCKKVETTEEVPTCIKRMIRKHERKSSSIFSVTRNDWNGTVIYGFNYFALLGGTKFIDEDCNEICSSSLNSSNADLCRDILDNVSNSRVIWTKDE